MPKSNAFSLSKLTLAIVCANSMMVVAGPSTPGGTDYSSGIVTVDGLGTDTTTINQSNSVVTIEWGDFDVLSHESVIFNQNANDVAINNIGSATPSNIQGNITAGGTIFLSNSNGFIFGANSSINTGSFLATTSDVSLSGDEINLSNPAGNGSIQIHQDADINANQGFLAFISENISTDPGNTDTPPSGGLTSDNGDILISNDTSSTIKLAGLDMNIDFSGSSFTGANDTNTINLNNADLSSRRVILTSSELASVLDSVVNQANSLSAEDLIVSGDDIGNSISTLTNDALDQLSLSSLTLDHTGPSDFQLSGSSINTQASSELIINSDNINLSTSFGNILGSSLGLTLNAESVMIGNFSQEFGGPNGLGRLEINTADTGAITLEGNVNSNGDIEFNGDTIISRNDTGTTLTKIRSANGSVTLNGDLSFNSSNGTLGNLYIRATGEEGISLFDTTGFNSLNLYSDKLSLNGNLSSLDTISIQNISDANNHIHINGDINLTSNTIEIEDFYFTANNDTDSLSFRAVDNTDVDFSVILKDSSVYDGNEYSQLNSILIDHNAYHKVILSGDFNLAELTLNSSDNEIDLAGDTSFSGINTLALENTTISGDYIFSVNGEDSISSTASIGSIENIQGAELLNFNSVTLNGDISTKENGLSIQSNNILLDNSSGPITISNDNGGIISLVGNISSNNLTGLEIQFRNSDLYLGTISDLSHLSISKELKEEGTNYFSGSISTIEDITLTNLGNVNIQESATFTSENGAINIADSSLIAGSYDLDFFASTITLDAVSASNVSLNSSSMSLHGDLTSLGNLDFIFNDAILVDLADDLTLEGNLNFLASDSIEPITFTGNRNLSMVSSNENIYLGSISRNSDLNSLSISTNGQENPANLVFETDSEGAVLLPNLNGIQGLSLLGNMYSNIGADQVFDTSSYDGNLDLSGVTLNGSGSLTFKTGTGELSLGSIGTDPLTDADIFTALNISSTGKLNLHGQLNIATTEYNFSSLNAIELHSDLTLGSSEIPTSINFGTATLNGTYDLTLYTNNLTLGTVGNNIALQDLEIFHTGELSLSNDIVTAGDINISSTSLNLDNSITSTGSNVTIKTDEDLAMSGEAEITAGFGDITLNSTTGNIGIGKLVAENTVTVRSEAGYLYNSIDDHISNSSTSVNITSTDQYLFGFTNIGTSVGSPIVVDVQNDGTINAESNGTVYIANLANARVITNSRLLDSSSGGETATTDALTQFKLASLGTANFPNISSNLGLISNLTWEVDEDESIRKIKLPVSAPAIYYSRNGWKLGSK